MALCEGCQKFRHCMFESESLEKSLEGRSIDIVIHESFAELSKCADTYCDLCKFIRRELCYGKGKGYNYKYSDDDLLNEKKRIRAGIQRWKYAGLKRTFCFFSLDEYRGGFTSVQPLKNHLRSKLSRRVIPDNPGFHDLLCLSRRWLATCFNEHNFCSAEAEREPTFLPTRLLDVGSSTQDSVRLVLTKDLPESGNNDYATLSYRWGLSNDTVCTTEDNLAERLVVIPANSMSKTILDAIKVTRALQVRYLWIDALCIVQVKKGINKDWERESKSMGEIYRHSVFTIAASSAKSSSEGLFYRQERSYWPVRDYPLVNESKGKGALLLEASTPLWNIAVENSVLAQRGWVLQERMLASRTLFWTDDGLFWSCKCLQASEYLPSSPYRKERGFLSFDTAVERLQGNLNSRLRQTLWTEIIETFSRKQLTVPTDKLAAVEGLGYKIARRTAQHFETGVWTHNLARELAWVVYHRERHPKISIYSYPKASRIPKATRIPGKPSWSWASVDEVIAFRLGALYDLGVGRGCEELVSNISLCAERIKVRGRVGKVCVKSITRTDGSSCFKSIDSPCNFEPVTARASVMDVAVFDSLADSLPKHGGIFECIQWMRWNTIRHTGNKRKRVHEEPDKTMTGALIVSPVDQEDNTYRRIGWLDVVDSDFFDKESRDLILV